MNKKELARLKRHRRIRKKMQGIKERPRLVVKRSLNNLFAQIIDDTENKVLFSYSTASKDFKQKAASAGNIKSAQAFGEAFSKLAKAKGLSKVIFDRAGYLYHGRVKEFAEFLRKGGMEF
jgi:large subunit ribosomal protein L18